MKQNLHKKAFTQRLYSLQIELGVKGKLCLKSQKPNIVLKLCHSHYTCSKITYLLCPVSE